MRGSGRTLAGVPEPLRFDEVRLDHAGTGAADQAGPAGPVRVIVKVHKSGYVPEGFDVRTRVDDLLFTAEASESGLRAAAADPDVQSVERGRGLRLP